MDDDTVRRHEPRPRPGGKRATAQTRHAVRPVGAATGRLALVDGHPVCDACGAAVEPSGPDRWKHGRGPDSGSPAWRRWLAPVEPRVALRLSTYEAFADRYPWAVHPVFGGRVVTTRDDWREAMTRLARYREGLATVRRWRQLRPGENPYLELVALLGAPAGTAPGDEVAPFLAATAGRSRRPWPLTPGAAQALALPARRRELASLFSWAIPTEEALDAIAALGERLIEGGAGTGYWAALLAGRGVDIAAFDLEPPGRSAPNRFHATRRRPWHDVQRLSTRDAVRCMPDRTLLLVWPPHGDDAASHDALRAYRGETLVLAGEGEDGATDSIRFRRELARNWTERTIVSIPRWPGLADQLTILVRNETRRAITARDRCPTCRRFVPTGSLDRCDRCIRDHPPALAIRVDGSRVEYTTEQLDAMPHGLRAALEASPNRIG